MSWSDRSYHEIQKIDAMLAADVTFEQRVKALRDGYPFAERRGWAYKSWLREQRKYLAKYQPTCVDTKRFPLSPLERMMARVR